MADISGKTVLVTGSRSGIGRAVAVTAARHGAYVYAGLRDLDTAGALVAESAGLDVAPIALDVTDAAQREAAVARILDERGRVDVLVNNAGVALGGPLEQVAEDELRHLFEVNVFGAWALTKACLPSMRAQRRGRVINISSMAGIQATPCLSAYAGSKFALEGLSEGLHREVKDLGVDVILVEPGPFRTDIFGRNRAIARAARDEPDYAPLVDAVEALAERVIDRAAGDPQEVADLVVDLMVRARPALRHPIGAWTRTRAALGRWLPQRTRERLFSWVVARAKRRGGR